MSGHQHNLEKLLAEARARLKAASAALEITRTRGEWSEFHDANGEVLRLERELAACKGEPYAEPCDFPVKWDVGAPLPFLLCTDYQTYLTFYINEPDPNWDGTYVKTVELGSNEKASLCLVTFMSCVSAKLGHPNDEVQEGHPLAGRGLEGYTAQDRKELTMVERGS